jgi:prepilin-type N-terminal cleavage/methylation domain-containing protein
MKRPIHLRPTLRRRLRAGFTLAEMVVSLGISAVLMDMLVKFYVEEAKYMYTNEQKLTINKDMRVLTAQMSDDARYANFFVMYSNYTVSARTSPSQELLQANSGDFLVFVFYGNNTSSAPVNVRPISELVGYYREPYQSNQLYLNPMTNAPASLEPVHRFDLSVANGTLPANQYLESASVPSGGVTTTIEALLPDASAATIASHPIVVQLANGLADGCLFHNFWGKSVMINGQIVQGDNYMSASDTYNFTISPRG